MKAESWLEQVTAYPMCGTTQATDKRLQAGDNVIVDFHPLIHTFMSDLSHNFILGNPTRDQQKLANACQNSPGCHCN